MSMPLPFSRRIAAAVATACAGLALVSAAGAFDLRDWGRKYHTPSERLVVLAQSNNQDVLDKETQLVGERSADPTPRHFHRPDQQLVTERERLEEMRCRRRNQLGSNCRPSL